MPGATVRSISKTPSNGLYPIARRALHRLSDGNLVAVVLDSNWNGLAGDFGDNTNIAKIYIYTSANGEVWTLKATITTDLNGTDGTDYSSCIDALNNVHVIWKAHDLSVKYVKVTYAAGPTYTVGTIRTPYTLVAGYNTSRVDIDSLGNSTDDVIMALTSWKPATNSIIRVYHTNGGGATIHNTNTITLGGTPRTDSDYISIAGCKDAIVSNVATFVLMINQAFSKDLGERVQIIQINTSTGAQIATNPTITLPTAGKANGLRQHTVIIPDNQPRTVYVTGVFGDGSTTAGGTMSAWKFTINSGVTRTDVIAYHTRQMPAGSHTWGYAAGWQFANMSLDSNGRALLYLTTTNFVYTCSVDLSGTVPIWRTVPYTFDQIGNIPGGGAISCISAGGQRNLTIATHGVLVWYTKKTFQVHYLGIQVPPAPINISPAGGQSVSTDRPTFSAQFKEVYSQPQLNRYIKWQVASDSAFTTNLKSIIDDTSYRPLNTPGSGGAVVVTTEVADASEELFQGLWYIRAYEIDELNNSSPATPSDTFNITHPPVAANLAPNSSAVAIYGLGSVQMQWTFTDPSPYDFQTAYEIFVFDVDGNTIFDSGKLVSGNHTGVATIPSANKDQLLSWGVMLWDSDDISGPLPALQTFIVSDAPAPAITNPLDGAVLSALPNIQWTTGISGLKTQQSWRVVIKQGSTTVMDTGFVADSITTALQVPNGIMHNGNAYTITVTIIDNLGLSGSAVASVTTSWTAPAAPTTRVYLYEFDRRGFVFIGWDNALVDTNFIQWNVYRRKVGDIDWTLLEAIHEYMPTYGYRDYSAQANTTYQYVVTQISNSTGDLVESTHNSYVQVVTPSSRYWLLDPFGLLDAVPLFSVTAEDYADEQESSVFNLYGRGRHKDIGDYLGPNGSLTIQMRDKYLGIDVAENLFYDPAIQLHTVGDDPDQWVMASAGTVGNRTNDYQTFFEPAPDGKLRNFVYRADAFNGTTADRIALTQTIDVVRVAKIAVQANKFKHSWWLAPELDPANTGTLQYSSHAEYYNASNSLIGTEDITMTQVDTYEPVSSGDSNVGNWKRLSAQHTMTVGTDHIIISLRISNNAVGQNGVILGGAGLFAGTIDKPYFDGDFNGALWNAGQYISTSVSNGTYTAREQRLDIYGMRNAGHSAYIRNPFGDVWTISLDDPKFARLAGTGGSAEFGDITVDYVAVVS
jgi:hypothetical protein